MVTGLSCYRCGRKLKRPYATFGALIFGPICALQQGIKPPAKPAQPPRPATPPRKVRRARSMQRRAVAQWGQLVLELVL